MDLLIGLNYIKMENKIATVFGGGKRSNNTKEYQETILIGQILGRNGYNS